MDGLQEMTVGIKQNLILEGTMTIPIIFVLDSSGSMSGEKIRAVNTAMAAVEDIFSSMGSTDTVQIGVISFSTGFKWITNEMEDISAYYHEEMIAGGLTDLGSAIKELGKRVTPQDLLCGAEGNISKPIIIFMSDGIPTDEWERELEEAEKNPWFLKSVRLSIVVGDDADELVMGRLTIPTEEVDISGVWKDAARCVHVHTPDDIINILESIFYYSVADGYSQLDDSSVVKSSRILNNVLSGRILSEGERAMGGNFTVGYPSMTNVNINGVLELRRCQITSCSPKNAQDVVLRLEDKDDWLFVTNVSEMPLVATFTVSSLECRRIPHDSTDMFEILANPSVSSKLSLAVKMDFDTFGYMSITNNSDFDISVRHTIGDQGMYLRQDDYVTIGEGIQILKVVKGGKVANDWDNWDWD